jgi:UDP-2,3-diacylglucosamine pyrophosphatase LpxH
MTQDSIPDRQYRSIWISDVHLGTRGCKADFLLDFLKHTESEYLYLVGDIIDGWRLRRSWYWPQAHNDVVQKILRKARKGTDVVFVPGNHDEFARGYTEHSFGDIKVEAQAIHTTADGKRLLVLHGDAFDGVVKYAKWLAHLGDWAYTLALSANHWFNLIRRRLGYSYWSLSAYLKHKVKNAVQFIDDYEQTIVEEARRQGVDGVVCGHIHHAELRLVDGILYANDGDWVESCTALVEHMDGRLEIVHWLEQVPLALPATAPPLPLQAPIVPLPLQVKEKECAYSWSRMPGFLRSMASSARLIP